MAADAGLMDFIEDAGDLFIGPSSDSLIQLVHGTPDAAPMSYIGVVQATCLPGKLSSAMAFGAEVADSVTRVTGRSCLFCASLSGEWGGVSWITGSPDADSLQADNDTWSSDAGAIAMMDKAGDFFQPGRLHHLPAPLGIDKSAGRRRCDPLRLSRERPVEVAVSASPSSTVPRRREEG